MRRFLNYGLYSFEEAAYHLDEDARENIMLVDKAGERASSQNFVEIEHQAVFCKTVDDAENDSVNKDQNDHHHNDAEDLVDKVKTTFDLDLFNELLEPVEKEPENEHAQNDRRDKVNAGSENILPIDKIFGDRAYRKLFGLTENISHSVRKRVDRTYPLEDEEEKERARRHADDPQNNDSRAARKFHKPAVKAMPDRGK